MGVYLNQTTVFSINVVIYKTCNTSAV